MRWKIPAGVVLTLALLAPAAAAPSAASAATTCPTVFVYADFRSLVTIDLDTASDTEVRLLANQLQAEAKAEKLTTSPGRFQTALDGTPENLRTYLKSGWQGSWRIDLRVAVNQTMAAGGPNVKAAAQVVLDNGTVEAFLAFQNDGRYLARAADNGNLKLFADLRSLVTIDLDTASDVEVRLLANQLQAEAKAEKLTTLPGRLQTALDGTAEGLRTFLKSGWQVPWQIDLRVAVNQAMAAGGPNVKAAAQVALDDGTRDVFLAFLNHGLYVARAQDCA
ncbi:ALF repeat-containing protein [Dactylosporangium sp. CS-033363]|uniref:ALF repeat-containing protein n=1 Tax=Dactylosporangium sp. CS-033363 TaxID=3239935 RepID=UPI003D89ED77